MKQTKQNKQTNIQGWRRLQQMEKFKLLVHFRFESHELQLDYLTVRIVFFL